MFLLRVNTDTFDSSDCVVRRNGRFWYFDWETVRAFLWREDFAMEDTIVVDETAQEKIVDDNGTC